MFFQRSRSRLFLGKAERAALVRVRGTITAPSAVTSELSGRVAAAFRYVLGVARPFANSRVLIDDLGFAPVLGGWLGNEISLDVEGERLVVPLQTAVLQSRFTGTGEVLRVPLPAELDSVWRERRPRDGVIYFAEHALMVGSLVQAEGTVERARHDGYRGSASIHNEKFRLVSTDRVSLWEMAHV